MLEERHRATGDIWFSLYIDGTEYTEKLEGFSVSKHANFELARIEISYFGAVVSEILGGRITYDSSNSLSGFLNTYPEQGRFEVGGANESRVSVVPLIMSNSTLAEVQYDELGNGQFRTLEDPQFWSSFTSDFSWSYSPTRQQYIRPFDPDDFWYVGGVPMNGAVVPVMSSIRLQFSREIDASTVPETIPMVRMLNEPPNFEVYEAATDLRGAAVILRPMQQLRHGSDYTYPQGNVTVSDRSGNTALACCETFNTPDNLVAVAQTSKLFGISQETIELDGSMSTSTTASIVSYTWSQIAGTPAVISNGGQPTAIIGIPAIAAAEILEFQLEITDANGEKEWDSVQIHAYPDASDLSYLYFYGDEGDYVSLGREWLLSNVNGTTTVQRTFYNGIQFSSGTWHAFFSAPGDVDIEVGSYQGAVRYQSIGSDDPELSLGGDGRSCNKSTGSFDVLEIQYDGGGNVILAAIDFVQYCDGSSDKLTGHLRVGSSIPVSVMP